MYDCEVCSERIKRNFSSISGHLAVKHGMTTRDYERRFGLGDYEVEVPADDVVAEIVLMSEPGFPRMKTRQLCQLQEVRAQDEEAAGHARRVQWLRVPLARPSRGGRGRVAVGDRAVCPVPWHSHLGAILEH